MNLTELPFNALVGIEKAEADSALLTLRERPELHNHLGTFHAGALFSLAEASSAEFLLRHRGEREDIGGVVRKATCKYSKPANGTLSSHSPTPPETLTKAIGAFDQKSRALLTIEIELKNESQHCVASFSFTWFLGVAPQ